MSQYDILTPRVGESVFKFHFRRMTNVKPFDLLQREGATSEMNRSLGRFQLIAIGIGCIIGTGIFVLTGQAAARYAGPGLVISFLIAAVAAGTAAFSYSEVASMVPISGSAYTYTYATMGEFMAWFIGWDLILEYLVGAATVAVGWSAYIVTLFKDVFGVEFPISTTQSPLKFEHDGSAFGQVYVVEGAYINIPAIFISLAVTSVLVLGIRQSSVVNLIVVVIKLFVILLFIFGAAQYVNTDNYSPFVPERNDGKYGFVGVIKGAQTVFFAYIGFDAVSTAAQEARDPGRDLPIGIVVSLLICTALYIATSVVLTGVAPYHTLDVADPIPFALKEIPGTRWLRICISFGAVFGLTSVILVLLMSQPRIFYAMSKDGMLPPLFSRIHPKFRTPYIPTIICGTMCALLSGFLPVDILGDMTSVGTLCAFTLVNIGVMILRRTQPTAKRGFRVPFGPVLPTIGAVVSLALVIASGVSTLVRLFIWLLLGIVVYAFYSRNHTKINNFPDQVEMYETSDEMKKMAEV